jgi:hypothetical protein
MRISDSLPSQPSLEETIRIVTSLHGEQVDWNGEPYWKHPLNVMRRMADDEVLEIKQIALLHDVLEDTKTTSDDLRMLGFTDYTVRGVELVSRNLWPPGITYLVGITDVIVASGHIGAMKTKLCDNTENSDPSRIADYTPENQAKFWSMRSRYLRSIDILREGIATLKSHGRAPNP